MEAGARRRYDNAGRRAAAEATRRGVISAAGETFAEHGYAATTLTEVAGRAGVSVETIKKRFGTKRDLLVAWFDAAVAGDEGVAVADSRWVVELGQAGTLEERVEIAAAAVTATHRQAASALTVAAAAAHADADIADWWAGERTRRRQDVDAIVPVVLGDASSGLPHEQLVDAVYAISEAHTFHVLTHELGWPDDRYRRWLASQLTHLVAAEPFDDGRQGGPP